MKTIQPSSAAGVLAPSLHPRIDLAKWQIGLAEANNMLVHVHGGVSNRPGTCYIDNTKDDKFARLIPFRYSASDNLRIEFTDKNMRLVEDGVVSDFPANVQTWMTQACVLDESGDFIQAPNPSRTEITYSMTFKIDEFPAAGIKLLSSMGVAIDLNGYIYLAYSRTGVYAEDTTYYNAYTGYNIAVDEEVTLEIRVEGNYRYLSRPGYWEYPFYTYGNTEIPCRDSSYSYASMSGCHFNNYLSGATVGELTVSEFSARTSSEGYLFRLIPAVSDSGSSTLADSGTSDNGAETTVLTDSTKAWTTNQYQNYYVYNTDSGKSDKIVSNTPTALTVTKDLETNNDAYEIRQYNNEGCYQDSVSTDYHYNQGNVTNTAPLTAVGEIVNIPDVASPYAEADLREVRFIQREDVIYFTHPSYPEYALTRYTDYWTMLAVDRTGGLSAPTDLAGTPTAGSGGTVLTVKYKVASIKDDGSESRASDEISVSAWVESNWSTGGYVTLDWTPVEDADAYVVYKNNRGYFGYIGTVEGTEFVDDNVSPDAADGPLVYQDPLSGENNYAKAVGIHQQRKTYGGSNSAPSTTYLTRSGSMENLSISRPLKDNDAITAPIDSNQVPDILHFTSMKDLVLITDNGVWTLDSGANQDSITPNAIHYEQQSAEKGSYLPPIVTGNTILMVPNYRDGARELFYQVQSQGFEGSDLEIMSSHLFEHDTVVDWDFQRSESVVWMVMESGKLCTLTYMREHEVLAWTTHETEGEFESVCVLEGATRDVPYFTVKRTIDGSTVRHIEELCERLPGGVLEDSVFMDASISYNGTATTSFTGATHLANETCVVLADGDVIQDVEVSGTGTFTLDRAASKVHIGIPYVADFETLDINYDSQEGTGFTDLKSISAVVLSLLNTRGISIGPDEDNLVEMKDRTDENYSEHTRMITGKRRVAMTPKWNTNGRIHVRQPYPLPVTILAHAPEVIPGDS